MAKTQPKANETEDITTNINTAPVGAPTVDPIVKSNREMAAASIRKKELLKHYKNEKKVMTYLSPMYRPYFGNVMIVTINGISIRFPVDGSKHEVPVTFSDEIERRRKYIDSIIKRQKRMADVSTNVESNPGELELF